MRFSTKKVEPTVTIHIEESNGAVYVYADGKRVFKFEDNSSFFFNVRLAKWECVYQDFAFTLQGLPAGK